MYPTLTPEGLPDAVALCAHGGRALFLHGAAGVGKSAVLLGLGGDARIRSLAWSQWAAAKGGPIPDPLPELEVIHLTIPQMEAEDFTGVPWHRRVSREGEAEDRATSWAPVDFLRRPHPILLFLDEVNAAELRVQKVLLQIVQERRVFNVSLAPGTVVVLAGNRPQDRAALKTVPFPLGNRCAHFTFEPSAGAWLAWAREQGLPEGVRAFVAQHREGALHAYDPEDPSLAQLTPRSLEGAARALIAVQALGLPAKAADDAILANLGQRQGLRLCAFLRLRDELPGWEEIVQDPEGARLPPPGLVDRVYQLASLLLEQFSREGLSDAALSAGLRYAERLAAARPESVDALAWLCGEVLRRHGPASEQGARLLNGLAALPTLGPRARALAGGL